MKNLRVIIGSNLLWAVSTLFSFYMVFVLRDFFLIVMETLRWGEYTINLIDKLLILVIGLITVIFFLYIQHAYQHKGWFLFFLVTSIQLVLYGTISFLKIVLINFQIPILQTFDFLLLFFTLTLSIISFFSYRVFKKKQS